MRKLLSNRYALWILVIAVLTGFPIPGSGQYFGKNKPMYHTLDFEVLSTPHFDIHYYLQNRDMVEQFANDAEHWYMLHKAVLQDSFYQKKPIVLYSDHSDFQMTNTVYGDIGIGTGGVTEGLKNRLVMPLTFSRQQTHHVLGHEMVHVFQYDMMAKGAQNGTANLQNIPLWMIEGLAEYLSIGRVDAHTAMWMRDAVINQDVPSIKDLNSYKYFPYRYGQAFWAYLAGTYGDQVIQPFFMGVAQVGLDEAIETMFGKTREEMSDEFISTLTNHYKPLMGGDMKENFEGRKILSGENAGELNVSPSVSPDGRYVVFLSDRNLFNTDLYVADARDGQIRKRITTLLKDGDVDDMDLLESSGTWSPDSDDFAYVAYDAGQNVIIIKEAESGKLKRKIKIDDIHAIKTPAWTHDGKSIIFSGMKNGQVDLYSYNLRSDRVKRLTNDIYTQIQPNINKHGNLVVFATDELSIERGRTNGKFKMNMAILNLETEEVEQIDVFPGADNVNPCFDHEGNIIFLSDRDGFRNMYKYNIATGEVFQMTNFLTGISGITPYSPAISVSTQRDRVVYTHYHRGDYAIYQSRAERMLNIPVDPNDVDFTAATLPANNPEVQQVVQSNMEKLDNLAPVDDMERQKYRPRFTLDQVGGSAGIGIGVGGAGAYGARSGLGGAVQMLFGDMLGDHLLIATLAVNGDFKDIGGQLTYLNRKHRVVYGASISHFPLRYYGYSDVYLDTLPTTSNVVPRQDEYVFRVFQERVGGIVQYPLSKATRIESNLGVNFQNYRLDLYPVYFRPVYPYDPIYFGDRVRLPLDDNEEEIAGYLAKKGAFYDVSIAYVGDNAQFGMTSPMNGYRYRVEFEQNFGVYKLSRINFDVRGYKYLGKLALAARLQHSARLGPDASSFNPIFIGWQGLVHGYDYNHIDKLARSQNEAASADDVILNLENVLFDRSIGSKYLIGGLELRLPFSGPDRLAVIPTRFLLTDLSLFFDVGMAFDEYSELTDGAVYRVRRLDPDGGGYIDVDETYKPLVAASAGLSLRVNLFNALVLEPYLAYPLQKNSQVVFGFNFVPGW